MRTNQIADYIIICAMLLCSLITLIVFSSCSKDNLPTSATPQPTLIVKDTIELLNSTFEKNNLVKNPEYQQELEHMQRELHEFMVRTKDPLLEGPIAIRKKWKINKKETYSPSSKNTDDYESVGEKIKGDGKG